MHDSVLESGWETLLFAAPLVGMLLFGLFRLDTIFAAPKQAASLPRRPASGFDQHGRVLVSDPDGRPWKNAHCAARTAPGNRNGSHIRYPLLRLPFPGLFEAYTCVSRLLGIFD